MAGGAILGRKRPQMARMGHIISGPANEDALAEGRCVFSSQYEASTTCLPWNEATSNGGESWRREGNTLLTMSCRGSCCLPFLLNGSIELMQTIVHTHDVSTDQV